MIGADAARCVSGGIVAAALVSGGLVAAGGTTAAGGTGGFALEDVASAAG